ncbi:MAG: hypothetical protein QOH95_2809, partial [Gaiellaceae bacterium]|nr:hypothetical protein [Gaiellaceae bacterium]
MRIRRALVGTFPGEFVKRLLVRLRSSSNPGARPAETTSPPAVRARGTQGQNIALISHCDFGGNSAMHVYAIATELRRRGFRPAVIVPSNARSVRDLGRPAFPVLTYRQARNKGLGFESGQGPDLVHAFTPREHVRRFTVALAQSHDCPYVVHLEDNEAAIVGAQIDQARTTAFLSRAVGITAVVDRLLELKPASVPAVVMWPGFDERILSPSRPREEVRKHLEVDPSTIVVAYTGNTHASNLDDVGSLYAAISELREAGRSIVLVRTGWDFVPRSALPSLGPGIRALGWVARDHIPEVLVSADILVQPGAPSAFNDYR